MLDLMQLRLHVIKAVELPHQAHHLLPHLSISSFSSASLKNLISVLRNRTGLVESSFQGCYSSKQYIVPYVR